MTSDPIAAPTRLVHPAERQRVLGFRRPAPMSTQTLLRSTNRYPQQQQKSCASLLPAQSLPARVVMPTAPRLLERNRAAFSSSLNPVIVVGSCHGAGRERHSDGVEREPGVSAALAVQHADDEGQTREQPRQAREREKGRHEEYVEAQQQAAGAKDPLRVERQIKTLDEVLTRALTLPPFTFKRLMTFPKTPEFDPGPLGHGPQAPDWSSFEPAAPRGCAGFWAVPRDTGARWRRPRSCSPTPRQIISSKNGSGDGNWPPPRAAMTAALPSSAGRRRHITRPSAGVNRPSRPVTSRP